MVEHVVDMLCFVSQYWLMTKIVIVSFMCNSGVNNLYLYVIRKNVSFYYFSLQEA